VPTLLLAVRATLQIKSGYEEGKDIILTVQSAMGEEQIVTLKEIGGGKN
jgi:translation initiation factor 5A